MDADVDISPLADAALKKAESANHRVADRLNVLDFVPKGGVCAELGVFTGLFSEQILRVAEPIEFHMVDPWWVAYGDSFPDWGLYTAQGTLRTKTAHDAAMMRTKPYEAKTKIAAHVGYSADWLNTLPGDYLDWVYVDSSHQEQATYEELGLVATKLKAGGIITGDDWWIAPGNHHFGVFKAVQRFCAKGEFEIIFCDRNAQWAIRRRTW